MLTRSKAVPLGVLLLVVMLVIAACAPAAAPAAPAARFKRRQLPQMFRQATALPAVPLPPRLVRWYCRWRPMTSWGSSLPMIRA